MKSICFVGIDNYPVLNPAFGNEKIGGESVQQTLLAKEFLSRGYEVSMVVKDYGQPQNEVIDGIRCCKSFRTGAGLPVFRYIYPRIYKLWRALSMANADIYYQSCASMLTGLTAKYAKRNNRTFIFRLAHDTDCKPGQQLIPYKRDMRIYEYGLRGASHISSQSQYQKDMLLENYGLESSVIDMLVEDEKPAEVGLEKDIEVLWVNNIRPIKRPDVFLDVVEALPNVRFIMAGGKQDGHINYYEEIANRAQRYDNLVFLGAVPYVEIGKYFSRARLFLNTSDSEGFPNTFLQSWVRGVPVCSFFDPDGVIEKNGLGVSPNSFDQMTRCIEMYLNDQDGGEWKDNAKAYIKKYHSPASIVDQYISLFGI